MKDQELLNFIQTARQLGRNDSDIVQELLTGSPPSKELSPEHSREAAPQPPADVLIRIRNVSKIYQPSPAVTVTALQNINLDVYTGEFLAVTGQSGSGKSTLLNLLALIDDVTSGSIEVAGTDLTHLDESEQTTYRLRTVSMIFQFFNLIENYTALENIIFQLLLQGISFRVANRKAEEMLQYLDLLEKKDAYPKDLSGGQQQRVAVGRALAKDSQFILADEPTAHLDAENSQAMIKLLRDINQQFKRTIILVSHEQTHTRQADRVITLKDGVIENR